MHAPSLFKLAISIAVVQKAVNFASGRTVPRTSSYIL